MHYSLIYDRAIHNYRHSLHSVCAKDQLFCTTHVHEAHAINRHRNGTNRCAFTINAAELHMEIHCKMLRCVWGPNVIRY